ncbi:acid protease [Leucogyrophana mollusca]|uniref:Acid protease n=1 Tax=Leucogyrophana mollusca TaxID=85980 RepID=A0ACB8BRW4_9AGAM|nr:acid protease [Leucogyrophana mollusca]
MGCTSWILFATTLLALVAALPQSLGPAIALHKRSNLHKLDGTVDLSALRRHIASTEVKIQRGLSAYAKNTGAPSAHAKTLSRRSSGSDPLTDDSGVRWYGDITVGTPPTTYSVDFDTGSADLFLPGTDCGSSCDGHKLYNPASSSTSKDVNKTFTMMYGDGSSVLGEQYTDTVSIAGYAAKNQVLGVASQYSSAFSSSNFAPDGLMGLAFKLVSTYNSDSVFQTLVAQGAVPQSIFSFKLATSGSELRIGGMNNALYTGGFTWTDVTEEGYWQIDVDGISANGNETLKGLSAIVDTGTTLILGQTSSVQQFYDAVGGTDVGGGLYTLPCDSMPSVSVTLGGKSFTLSSDTFNFGTFDSSGETCVGGISASDSLGDLWVLGDVFLRNVYTVFDLGNSRVGYADLA